MQRKIPKVHLKDGRWYFVENNKWTGLSREADGIRELGHVGQMRERYTRRRKLVPVR